jgi:hypothetical protein
MDGARPDGVRASRGLAARCPYEEARVSHFIIRERGISGTGAQHGRAASQAKRRGDRAS